MTQTPFKDVDAILNWLMDSAHHYCFTLSGRWYMFILLRSPKTC